MPRGAGRRKCKGGVILGQIELSSKKGQEACPLYHVVSTHLDGRHLNDMYSIFLIFSKLPADFVRNIGAVSALAAAPVIDKPVERETLTVHLFSFSL
jgi:hypothetical protein